jgi:uncharacterized membrane protein YkvA (DUF1232 family)
MASDFVYVMRNFAAKLAEVGGKVPFVRMARGLYDFMVDPEAPVAGKAVAAAALAYFVLPVDAIPDVAPVVGYLDDAGVIAAAVAYLESAIKPYLRQ